MGLGHAIRSGPAEGSSAARRAYEFSPRAGKAFRLKNESQQGRPRTERVTLVKVPARSSHGDMPGARRIGGEKAAERVMGRKMVRSLAAPEWPRCSRSDRPRPRPGQKPNRSLPAWA